MSKSKVKNSLWFALFEGLKIYFSNIDKFLLYMLFPVFGQIVGLVLSFWIPLGLANKIANKVDTPMTAMIFILLLALPGLLILTKAFWNYMVAYVALNSMTEGAVSTGKVYDFQSHNEVATRRAMPFILLLLIVGALSSVGSTIFFIVPGFIVWIYLILVYQVFTFEPELGITDIFKRSFLLIRGNWFRTVILLVILSFFSIFIITQGMGVILDFLNLTNLICSLLDRFTSRLSLDLLNDLLSIARLPEITPTMISKTVLYSILSFIVSGLTLPIRSICWTLWYMILSEKNSSQSEVPTKQKKSSRKKASAKED